MTAEKRGETFVIKEGSSGAIDFSSFLVGLASSTLIHLGQAPNPESGKREKDLTLARETMDLLSILREKTRGNLTAEEEQLFGNMLTDLRFRFIEAQKQ